jgi:hypothetical protein
MKKKNQTKKNLKIQEKNHKSNNEKCYVKRQ